MPDYHPSPSSSAGSPAESLEQRLVGVSSCVHAVRKLILQVAPSNSTVLLLGESGTGKEVIARGVHDCSARANGPFVPVNCGAIPGELLESELFGHEKGAFTGAVTSRKGRFELAEGGTLFLDEIGDMPLEMQVKLLRVLQERTFERVGATKALQCDVRIVAATHQRLEQKVEDGSFRMDLFYRLNVFPIDVPPLRDRSADISLLANRFIQLFEEDQRGSIRLMPDALEHLEAYAWPGNVRELGNLVERLTILHPDSDIYAADLPIKYRSPNLSVPPKPAGPGAATEGWEHEAVGAIADLFAAPAVPADEREDLSLLYGGTPTQAPLPPPMPLDFEEPLDLKAHLIEVEKTLILAALDKADWVNAQAAKLLCLQRTTLVEKMRKYEIQRPEDED